MTLCILFSIFYVKEIKQTAMIKAISYDSIDKKNDLEKGMHSPLTPEESLIHCLNVMDFMAVFRNKDIPVKPDNIKWIVLEKKKK